MSQNSKRPREITMDEWEAAWEEALPKYLTAPPPGAKSIAELCGIASLSLGRMREIACQKVNSGEWERFAVHPHGSRTAINYYRPKVPAPSKLP